MSWCCATLGRWARRGCPNGARCRSALWAGVRLDVLAARKTGRPGLRLRLPGDGFRRARAGAGDLLMLPAADAGADRAAFEGQNSTEQGAPRRTRSAPVFTN